MDQTSEFPGPNTDDYRNVLALNTAFMKAAYDMSGPQRGRIATAPFLLFSLRESDPEWWDAALVESPQVDLIAAAEFDNPSLRCIQIAALSFLWHLAHRNPYATRIISGASVWWCEKIIDLPLVTLLDRAGGRADLMLSRLDNEPGARLLANATSSRPKVCRSSQLVALQSLLTHAGVESSSRLAAAACQMKTPMRVQEKKM